MAEKGLSGRMDAAPSVISHGQDAGEVQPLQRCRYDGWCYIRCLAYNNITD